MALCPPQETIQSAEEPLYSGLSTRQTFLGLTSTLWRIAFVTGIAQLSVSIWIWEFAISLEPILTPWQIGLTFTAGTLAALLGYPIAGAMADTLGRRNTLIISFIPQIGGLAALYLFPVWPLLPMAYGIQSFGWSFVLVVSRAIPADAISLDSASDASRKLTMVLMPAFLVDGMSPVLAVFLLSFGFPLSSLLLIGIIAATASLIATELFVRETLLFRTRQKTIESPGTPLRQLGRPFWIFTGGMIGYYIAWGMSLPYLGILIVSDWSIGVDLYGFVSGAFSLTSVSIMYSLSGLTGRNTKSGLTLSLVGNAVVMTFLGLGFGTWLFIILNIIWAGPIVVWISAENVLTINGVPQEMKGRALGTYQFATSATGVLGAPLGAFIWSMTGNLRFLWVVSGVLAAGFALVVWTSLIRVKIHRGQSKKHLDNVISVSTV
jgi:MFS family permease